MISNFESYDNLIKEHVQKESLIFSFMMKDSMTDEDYKLKNRLEIETKKIQEILERKDIIDVIVDNDDWKCHLLTIDDLINYKKDKRYYEYSKLIYFISLCQLNREKNKTKEDFSDHNLLDLINKAEEELIELKNEVMKNGGKKRILEEIGDVCAYMAGIASLVV